MNFVDALSRYRPWLFVLRLNTRSQSYRLEQHGAELWPRVASKIYSDSSEMRRWKGSHSLRMCNSGLFVSEMVYF